MKSRMNANAVRTWLFHAGLCQFGIVASIICLFGLIAGPASGDGPCTPQWSDEFPSAGDVDNVVRALAQFDVGSGPQLFVGGHFSAAGDVPASRVAQWDGQSWSALATGVVGYTVVALAEFDDGNGPAIYAGGFFTEAGGKPASNIARWDGEEWSPVGLGVNGVIWDIIVYDDGSGPALIAAGYFTEAGGAPANRIARWDGETWSPLGGGFDNAATTLAVIDDEVGETLVAGGAFTEADGAPASRIAKWDGTQWVNMDAGFDDTVRALTVIEDGGNSTLVAGGTFSQSGKTDVHRIAQWDGTAWQPLGDLAITGSVVSLTYGDIGDGPALYAGLGSSIDGVQTRVAKWTGDSWLPLGAGVHGSPSALVIYEDVNGPVLYAGGYLHLQGHNNFELHRIIRWTGDRWVPFNRGLRTTDGFGAFALEFFGTDDDEYLYAGGGFTSAGDSGPTNLTRWDGHEWSSIGIFAGPSSSFNPAYTIKTSDVGGVPSLYVGGSFTAIDDQPVNRIASWDGTNWQALGSGVADGDSWASVFAIAEFDDGRGPRLIVGGQFTTAGGLVASNIAAWDGVKWHPLGSGTNGTVNHMVVFDDGSGPSLYVSGQFSMAGGVYAGGLARWDGSKWHSVGSITASWWNHAPLAVHDGKLIVGDTVTLPSGTSYGPVAVFDGESWMEWSEGYGWFPGWFATFDDGTGPALYSGVFVQQGAEEPMSALLKWDGSQWVVPDVGGVGFVDGEEQSNIIAMAVSSGGERLAVGGIFSSAGDTLSPHVAILEGCPALTPGDLDGDGVVNSKDLLILLSAWGPCPDPGENNCPADLNNDSVVDGMDLLILLANWS